MNNRQKAIAVFHNELNKISDTELKDEVINVFGEEAPSYFFTAPASSSGKYHPAVSGGRYGLIRHTKLVCIVADELMRSYDVKDSFTKDCVFAACILHDFCKYGFQADENGKSKEYTTKTHGVDAGKIIRNRNKEVWKKYDRAIEAIEGHMGIWSSEEGKKASFHNTKSRVSGIVHVADYIASRKFEKYYEELLNVDYQALLEKK